MKICYFGIYDPLYSRNDILLSGLKEAGAQIVECRENWKDRYRYLKLIKKIKKASKDCDIIYAAYPANIPTIISKFFTRKIVIMDALYPMYDSAVTERQEVKSFHPKALKLWFDDWFSALISDYIIVDTEEHLKYWTRLPFIKAKKIKVIQIGAQEIFFIHLL